MPDTRSGLSEAPPGQGCLARPLGITPRRRSRLGRLRDRTRIGTLSAGVGLHLPGVVVRLSIASPGMPGRKRVLRALLVTTAFVAASCGSGSPKASSPIGSWVESGELSGVSQTVISLSCPTSSFCAAVGSPISGSGTPGYAATWDGSSWTTPTAVDSGPNGALQSTSCVSPSFCMATDLNGGYTVYSGSSWSAPQVLDSNGVAFSVSCTSPSFCAAVGSVPSGSGTAAAAWVFNGSMWSGPDVVAQDIYLSAVSCASESFCAAVGGSLSASGYSPPAEVVIYNGGSWASPRAVAQGFALNSVSCASSRFCVAGSTNVPTSQQTGPGDLLQYNGTTWGSPLKVTSDSAPFASVSCPTSSFCMAVDAGSYVVTYNRSSWSLPRHGPGSNLISALTCDSPSLCMAVDTAGQTYRWSR